MWIMTNAQAVANVWKNVLERLLKSRQEMFKAGRRWRTWGIILKLFVASRLVAYIEKIRVFFNNSFCGTLKKYLEKLGN